MDRPSSSSSMREDFDVGYFVRICLIRRRRPACSGPERWREIVASLFTKALTNSLEYYLLLIKTIVMHLTKARKSLSL